jgi:hypothetical protein
MSASVAAAASSSAYWRAAGMTYLKYANLCAEVVRGSLKEPFLTKARLAPSVDHHRQLGCHSRRPRCHHSRRCFQPEC